jgi:hypothetical protein
VVIERRLKGASQQKIDHAEFIAAATSSAAPTKALRMAATRACAIRENIGRSGGPLSDRPISPRSASGAF